MMSFKHTLKEDHPEHVIKNITNIVLNIGNDDLDVSVVTSHVLVAIQMSKNQHPYVCRLMLTLFRTPSRSF